MIKSDVSFLKKLTQEAFHGEENIKLLINEIKEMVFRQSCENQFLNVFKDVLFEIEGVKNLDNVFIKFSYDRYDRLICLFCDYSFLLGLDNPGKVYVFFGKYHKDKENKNNMLMMYITHMCTSSEITMEDFESGEQKCGHGTFALKTLDELIRIVNKDITIKNKEVEKEYLKRKIIHAIEGKIEPGTGISREDLINLYKNNGYYLNGRLYRGFYKS